MGKVKVGAFSISIDGFGAGPHQSLNNPLGIRGLELHTWFRETETFRKMQGLDGGSQGIDNDFALESFQSVGAWILGRNMFAPFGVLGETIPGRDGGAIIPHTIRQCLCSRITLERLSRKAAPRSIS
jgi:dihydrofolate reductase